MVVGLPGHRVCPCRPPRQRSGIEADVVVFKGSWHMAMLVVTDDVGQMRNESAAECDVQQLHSTADSEHGHPALERTPGYAKLEAVPRGIGVADLGMRIRTIGRGIEIGASG